MFQKKKSGVRGVAVSTFRRCQDCVDFSNIFETFACPSEEILMILGVVEAGSRVLDFTSLLGGPQVFGERTQNRGEALCLDVAEASYG